jgi:hypothetical protein
MLEGLSTTSELRYQLTGQVTLAADQSLDVDLTAVTGTAALVWTFPPNSTSQNPDCTQAGVMNVMVTIDSNAPYSVPCANGQTAQGALTPMLTLGTHAVQLSAVDTSGYPYYGKSSTLVAAATPTVQQFDLDWSVGGATLSWTLSDGVSTVSCASAGVTTLYVNFKDSTGAFVFSGAGDAQPCTASSVVYGYLKPGSYAVFLQGTGAGSAAYSSSQASPPTVSVTAGVFPAAGTGPNILVVGP